MRIEKVQAGQAHNRWQGEQKTALILSIRHHTPLVGLLSAEFLESVLDVEVCDQAPTLCQASVLAP